MSFSACFCLTSVLFFITSKDRKQNRGFVVSYGLLIAERTRGPPLAYMLLLTREPAGACPGRALASSGPQFWGNFVNREGKAAPDLSSRGLCLTSNLSTLDPLPFHRASMQHRCARHLGHLVELMP